MSNDLGSKEVVGGPSYLYSAVVALLYPTFLYNFYIHIPTHTVQWLTVERPFPKMYAALLI